MAWQRVVHVVIFERGLHTVQRIWYACFWALLGDCGRESKSGRHTLKITRDLNEWIAKVLYRVRVLRCFWRQVNGFGGAAQANGLQSLSTQSLFWLLISSLLQNWISYWFFTAESRFLLSLQYGVQFIYNSLLPLRKLRGSSAEAKHEGNLNIKPVTHKHYHRPCDHLQEHARDCGCGRGSAQRGRNSSILWCKRSILFVRAQAKSYILQRTAQWIWKINMTICCKTQHILTSVNTPPIRKWSFLDKVFGIACRGQQL